MQSTINFKEVFNCQGVGTKENDRRRHGVFLLWYMFYLLFSCAQCPSRHASVTVAEARSKNCLSKATLILAHMTRTVMCNTGVYIYWHSNEFKKRSTQKSLCLFVFVVLFFMTFAQIARPVVKITKDHLLCCGPTMSNLFHF